MKIYLSLQMAFSVVTILMLTGCSNQSPSLVASPSPIVVSNVTDSPPPKPTDALFPSAIPQSILDGRIAILNSSRKYTEIAILNLRTSKIQDIDNINVSRAFDALSWSPDGQWISVGGMFPEFQNSHLLIMSPSGATMELPFYPHGANPDWSPDGRQIIYNSSKGFAILDINSGETYQLTYLDGLSYYPTWSPDGTHIAFVYNQMASTDDTFDQQWELWVVDSNGQNPRPIVSIPSIMRSKVDWSPDGEWIAFVSLDHLENGIANACGDIYIVKFDGSNLTRLTNLDECATNISWSPDGQKIAFIGRNRIRDRDIMKSGWQVYIMNVDGKNIVQVTNESEWVLYSITWEPIMDK